MTAPMRSPVSVAVPKATVARYRLRPAVRNCDRRVALPITTGNTPVANGSSVPVCPTRVLRGNRRRTVATTSCDVMPSGLSTMRTPSRAGIT